MARWKKDRILEFLGEYAPKAPVYECLELAQEHEGLQLNLFQANQALCILAEEALGFDKSGNPPTHLRNKRLAVRWALQQVIDSHGGVVCGPLSGGMERLYEIVEKEISQGKRDCWLSPVEEE